MEPCWRQSREIQVGFLLRVMAKKALSDKYKKAHMFFKSPQENCQQLSREIYEHPFCDWRFQRCWCGRAGLSDTQRASSVISVCVWEGVSGGALHLGQWAEKSHFDVVSLHLSSWRPRLSKRPWGGQCVFSLRAGHASSGTGHQDSKVSGL